MRPADSVSLPAGGRAVEVDSADGTRLNVRVFGPDSAPTIVLLHGYTQRMRMWAYQIADLADSHRIVVYDQRGHGRSTGVLPTSLTIEALADDLHAVLQTCLSADEKVVLAGHSMGGIAIMSWAARYSDEVAARAAAVLLVNTAASRIPDHIPLRGGPRRARPAAPLLVRQRLLTILNRRARWPVRYLALGDHWEKVHLDAIMEMIAQTSPVTLRRFLTAFLTMDLSTEVSKLAVPTVVFGGTRDRLLPPVHCRVLERELPQLEQTVLVPGCGHMGPWEARETVSELLAELARKYL